jgi:hypothetical protein
MKKKTFNSRTFDTFNGLKDFGLNIILRKKKETNFNNYYPDIQEIIKNKRYDLALYMINEIGVKYNKNIALELIDDITNEELLKNSLDICKIDLTKPSNWICKFKNPLIFKIAGITKQNINNPIDNLSNTILSYVLSNFNYIYVKFILENFDPDILQINRLGQNLLDILFYFVNMNIDILNLTDLDNIINIYKLLENYNLDPNKKYLKTYKNIHLISLNLIPHEENEKNKRIYFDKSSLNLNSLIEFSESNQIINHTNKTTNYIIEKPNHNGNNYNKIKSILKNDKKTKVKKNIQFVLD